MEISNIINILRADIKKMSRTKHFFFWILPLLVLSIFMTFYFSQIPVLMEFVCPTVNRELGAVENLQLIVILIIVLVAAYGVFHINVPLLKIIFLLISLFSVFIFFEEMDYGAHYGFDNFFLRIFGVSNVHNIDDNAKWYKRPIYLIITFLFILGPFLQSHINNQFLKYFIPLPRLIIVAGIIVVADLLPRFIVAFNIRPDGGFDNNIGEFSELVIYYLFLLYVYQLIFVKSISQLKTLP